MYKEEGEQIRAALSSCCQSGLIHKESRVILFGSGDYSRAIIGFLRQEGIEVVRILDNDKRKRGSYLKGIPVIFPEELAENDIREAVFIVCSHFWKEMSGQLAGLGVRPEAIVPIRLRTFGESLTENIKSLYRGRQIYRKITREYPGCDVLLCPYPGTGDIYLIGTFLEQFVAKEGIKDYVLVVVSSACKKTASIFPIDNIVVIDGPSACRNLVKYYMVCPRECRLRIMNDSWLDIYTNPVQWLRGLHGMNFAEMFRRFVFDLDKSIQPRHPKFQDKSQEIETLKERSGINGQSGIKGQSGMKGKGSVLLSPYAVTLSDMPDTFWEELAEKLKGKGYAVYTNVGSEEEKAIAGTSPLSFPLDMAPQLVSWMGGFVGIRSGLCDIISGAEAKKVILYDKSNFFFNASAFDYFSLNKMGLSQDAVEIQYDNQNLRNVLEQVLSQF